MAYDLIVFSHLRWHSKVQRPHHLLTRLVHEQRVFYFEEPFYEASEPRIDCSEVHPNLFVCQPRTPEKKPGFHDQQLPFLQQLLSELIQRFEVQEWAAWFYTPMALPLISTQQPHAVIYDCIDRLTNVLGAPKQLLQRETALLKVADLVFTGGPSLHEGLRQRHPQVHCFPSSVDIDHFGQARQATSEPEEQARLPRPRLGYFGVIDERVDLQLIDSLARAHPEWQLIMVGPVVKVDPDTLPLRSNIYYFGQQPYSELPNFLAGWDLCLLPFALNQSTRYVSPTKTLEYMVAELPIVSSPVADIASSYGEVVYLGENHQTFIEACERALDAPEEECRARAEKMREILSRTSWEDTAASIDGLISSVIQEHKYSEMVAPEPDTVENSTSETAPLPVLKERVRDVPVAVIGAGPTGLSAAYHLGDQALLIDQNSSIGAGQSVTDHGFTFDRRAHSLLCDDPYVHEMYQMLLGDNFHWQNREAWIHSKGVYTPYPFENALYGLPPDVVHECLTGAIEARFGPLTAAERNGAEPRSSASMLPFRNRRKTPRNLEDYIYETWGHGIARHFTIPYQEKRWATPLKELDKAALGSPVPDLNALIAGALQPTSKTRTANPRFAYPLSGGFQSLLEGFAPKLAYEPKLGSPVVAIAPAEHLLTLADGSLINYRSLVSTMHLPDLIKIMGDSVPDTIQKAADGLRYVSVRRINLGVGRHLLTEKHWVLSPEDTVFHDVFVQGNASPHCNAPGGFGLSCDISYSEHQPLPYSNDALVSRCILGCIKVGLLRPTDPIWVTNQIDVSHAFAIHDCNYTRYMEFIRNWLSRYDIFPAESDAPWRLNNTEHPFTTGRNAATQAMKLLQPANTG